MTVRWLEGGPIAAQADNLSSAGSPARPQMSAFKVAIQRPHVSRRQNHDRRSVQDERSIVDWRAEGLWCVPPERASRANGSAISVFPGHGRC